MLRLTRRLGVYLGLSAAMLAFGAACGSSQPASTPSSPQQPAASGQQPAQQAPVAGAPVYGGTFKITGLQIVHLDPHRTARDEYVHGPVYDNLVTYKDLTEYNEFIVVPSLAEKWDISADGKTYTFNLRKGVKFHNGDAMTADDVVYSLDRFRAKEPEAVKAYFLDAVDKIEKVDASTVRLMLKEPFAPTLAYLAQPYPAIVSKKTVEANGNSLKQAVNGTGPFKFVSHERGSKWVAEKNPDFWGTDAKGNKLPFLDKIEYIELPDYAARTAAFRAREAELHDWYRGPDVLNIPQSNPDSIQLKWTGLYGMAFAFNLNKKPFDDVRVRRAIAMAYDRRAVAKSVNVIGPGFLNPPLPGSVGKKWAMPYDNDLIEKELPYYKFDVAGAKKLLQEAGVSNLKMALTIRRDLLNNVTGAEIMRDNMKDIGIDLEIKAVETGAQSQALVRKDFDVIGSPRGLPIGDPDDALYGSFFSTSSQNYFGLNDKKIDDMILAQRRALKDEDRIKIIRDLEKYLADQVVWIYVNDADYASSWQPWVKNFRRTFATHVMLRAAWIDRK